MAAECHRQVRKHMQSVIRPGILMTDMCEQLENLNRKLVQENGLKVRTAARLPRPGAVPGGGAQMLPQVGHHGGPEGGVR